MCAVKRNWSTGCEGMGRLVGFDLEFVRIVLLMRRFLVTDLGGAFLEMERSLLIPCVQTCWCWHVANAVSPSVSPISAL